MKKQSAQDIDLSICIVSWNVKDLLGDCLASIRSSRPALKYEIVVVDNASRDGSGDRVAAEFPEAALVRNRVNLGFAAACNQAIRRSRGRYLLLLNPDTLIRKGALEEMVRFLDERPAAGGGGPRLIYPDGRHQPSVRGFPTFRSSLQQFTILGDIGLFRRARREYLEPNFPSDRASTVEQPMGAALFLRREALEEVGLLDEEFFLYFEEVDLCRRLDRSGRRLWYNPRAVVVHAGGGSTGQAGARALYWFFQSQFRYFGKQDGAAAAARFKLIFKPLFLAGLYWSIIRGTVSLLWAYPAHRAPGERERKRTRLQVKWRFLTGYLFDFLLL
ncbi:MAG: glycosyltransferase family 2 protein [PVC group bacterium]